MSRNDLFKFIIFTANEVENKPIKGAYECLKEIWFFLESDTATIEGATKGKFVRFFSMHTLNPKTDKSEFSFFNHDYTYCGKRNKIKLTESDFQNELIKWIDKQLSFEGLKSEHERKYNEFKSYIKKLLEQRIKKSTSQTPQTLKELFTDPEKWEYYINALCECNPPLLKKESGQYRFIGNPNNQIGVVGYYFFDLQKHNILKVVNSQIIAETLNNTILDFKIKESTVRSETSKYSKVFRPQLEQYFTKEK
jgi:hypothetical protein